MAHHFARMSRHRLTPQAMPHVDCLRMCPARSVRKVRGVHISFTARRIAPISRPLTYSIYKRNRYYDKSAPHGFPRRAVQRFFRLFFEGFARFRNCSLIPSGRRELGVKEWWPFQFCYSFLVTKLERPPIATGGNYRENFPFSQMPFPTALASVT